MKAKCTSLRRGQTAIEYAMVVAAIIIPLLFSFMMLGKKDGIIEAGYLDAVNGKAGTERLGAISAPYP